MGNGVIYYEYEDYDTKADAELGTFKIRRYHFDDESFVHPLHSVRFNPDRPYEIPIEMLMADKVLSSSKDEKSSTRRSHSSRRPRSHSSRRPTPQYSLRGMPSTQRVCSTSSVKGTSSFRYGMASSSLRKPRSWELIPSSEGWMCEGDDEKGIGGMERDGKGHPGAPPSSRGAPSVLTSPLRNGVARPRHLKRASAPPTENFLIKKGGADALFGARDRAVRPDWAPCLFVQYPSIKKEVSSEEDPEAEENPEEEEEKSEEEKDPEEEIPASPSLPMDIDATKDYLRFIKDLERRPEPSPLRSSQASVPDSPEEASGR
ncbi:hypothetical protein PIB30_039711 [Stylosanthes scabra]|uniref:Uncharacterized protein n=1 Tax=Stylosanthes scabra TaxID=79078 RepID=A0ABU6ZD29_9FABA|nr:hypothetical protein [Stylosanthes scabra]